MHIYFSGIAGAGMAPLALIAKDMGHRVSGSDKQHSAYIDILLDHGIKNIHIGQSSEAIKQVDVSDPIDWLVYSSALSIENPKAPELNYTRDKHIKTTKRDELINALSQEKKLKIVAVAGTHGKTTTTAMAVYLFKKLGLPISYILPAKTSFASLGEYTSGSRYFVIEADEFDRNFLSFSPRLSLITGVSWDHHEIYPTRDAYKEAFRDFINQSRQVYIWQEDSEYLGLNEEIANLSVLNSNDPSIKSIKLYGLYNRLDAYLACLSLAKVLNTPLKELLNIINSFPSLSRRMEKIRHNLYSDYAHTPEKIKGALNVAMEMASLKNQKLIIIYEPLTNRRQHYIKDDYRDSFEGADKLYWLPSYLAREDPKQTILSPDELISHLDNRGIAEPARRGPKLSQAIAEHLKRGDMVVAIAGGGGDSLDDWIRAEFS